MFTPRLRTFSFMQHSLFYRPHRSVSRCRTSSPAIMRIKQAARKHDGGCSVVRGAGSCSRSKDIRDALHFNRLRLTRPEHLPSPPLANPRDVVNSAAGRSPLPVVSPESAAGIRLHTPIAASPSPMSTLQNAPPRQLRNRRPSSISRGAPPAS